MAPKKRPKAKKVMTFHDMCLYLAGACGLEPKEVKEVITELAHLAGKELAKTEKFVIPQLVNLKLWRPPATKLRQKMVGGRWTTINPMRSRKVVKCNPSPALVKAADCHIDGAGYSSSSD